MPRRKKIMIPNLIRKSCITGKAVWVYCAHTYGAEWIAYRRVCEREIRRVNEWPKKMEERKDRIMRFLDKLTAGGTILDDLSREKKEAARQLIKMAENPPPCYLGFYEHIMEERRRKREQRNNK